MESPAKRKAKTSPAREALQARPAGNASGLLEVEGVARIAAKMQAS
jgi:hypothetical protein